MTEKNPVSSGDGMNSPVWPVGSSGSIAAPVPYPAAARNASVSDGPPSVIAETAFFAAS